MSTKRTPSADGGVEQNTQQEQRDTSGAARIHEQLPTGDYVALVTIFNGLLATALFARRCQREPLPDRVEPKDLALFALATQKLSRVITKDKVTAAFRAPFTVVEGKGGAGELEERPKGRGLRRAIGDLVSCPFCIGTWIASGFIYGHIFTPRLARTVASIFAVGGLADFLQQAYVKAQEMNDQV